jgi:hypothetical protein
MKFLSNFSLRKPDGDTGEGRRLWWPAAVALLVAVLAVLSLVIMISNYRFPQFFEQEAKSEIPGILFTDTLITLTEEMAGRWLPNDKIYPTVFLDNPQNFQMGELETVRYSVRVLRDKLTRLRTTDKIDPDAEAAFVFFSNDPFKWVLPSAESKYRAGVKSLKSYRTRLAAGQADFYPRADSLDDLLDQYVSLLGGVTTRLANAPRRTGQVLSSETAGDQYTKGEKYVEAAVPWTQIDDNFYYAQGMAYGLRQILIAVKHDFANILEIKKADELLERTIHVLDNSQFEPIFVLNGDRGSVFANHSLQLQSVLEDTRQKLGSLQDMINN